MKTYKPTSLDYHGYGIVNEESKTYFIKNLLPGEEATIDIISKKNNIIFAVSKNIITISPKRTKFKYDEIQDLIILDPKEQLLFQENITKHTLDKFKLDYKLMKIISNDSIYYYRNKATFIYDIESNKIGNFIEGTHNFYIPDNYLLNKNIIRLQKEFNNYLEKNKIKESNISKIVIQVNELDQILFTFIMKNNLEVNKDILNFNFKKFNVVSLVSFYNNKEKIYYGKNYLKFIINNLTFYTNAKSFLQVNTSMIKLIYDEIYKNISSFDIVLDAFSGAASIAQYVASKAKNIVCVELSKESSKLAKIAIKENKINNIKFICDDYFKVVNELSVNFNTIIVDPPRKGLNKIVTDSFNNLKNIKKIIYLSCSLATLARDLKELSKNYKIEKVIPIKNFYNTTENETLVILKRVNNDII